MTVVRKIQIAIATLGLIAVSHPAAATTAANKNQAGDAVAANGTGASIDEQNRNCHPVMQAGETIQAQTGEK